MLSTDSAAGSQPSQNDARATLLRQDELRQWRRLFIIALVFTLPLLILVMGFEHMGGMHMLMTEVRKYLSCFAPKMFMLYCNL